MRKHSTPRPWYLLVAVALTGALVFSLASAVGASAASHGHGHKAGKGHKKGKKKNRKAKKASFPLTGIYDSCSVAAPKTGTPLPNCVDRLSVLRQGGFRVVLNYTNGGGSLEQSLEYAAQAEAVGMQVIWNLGSYVNLNDGSKVPVGPKLDFVRATAGLPATWGYYIGDEHPENLPQIEELSGAVRNITNRPLLYVSRPDPSKLRPFKRLADYVGPDIYPVGPIDRASVCRTARWSTKMVKGNLAMVLQAYSWSIDYPGLNPQWPSASQMRQMRNQATRCGRPKLLMWFCFHCITDYHSNPDPYWRDLAWAANGVNLNPTYRMTSAGTAG